MGLFLIVGHCRPLAAAQFIPIRSVAPGYTISSAFDVSADGTTVVGRFDPGGATYAYRWTLGSSPTALNLAPHSALNSHSYRVSHDGNRIVGEFGPPTTRFRWTNGNPVELLSFLPGSIDDMTPDGSTLIGADSSDVEYLWNESTGVTPIGGANDPNHDAFAVSDNGQVVVGGFNNEQLNGTDAYHWTDAGGFTSIGRLPWTGPPQTAIGSKAYAVSADGSVIVGASSADSEPEDASYSSRAFRWTEETGMVDIGGSFSGAYGITPNGNVIVGNMNSNVGSVASVWDFVHGMRSIPEMLENDGYDLTDWRLTRATAISANGRVIIGEGKNPAGNHEAWVVLLDADEVELNPIFGDYNDDGTVNAADYTVWRDQFGTLVEEGTGPDGNNNGFVDSFDRLVWHKNYGNTSLGSTGSIVPEPSAIGLAILALVVGIRIRR